MKLRLLAVLALVACSNDPLDVAPNVDLGRFQGKWYEVAKLPRSTQSDCVGTTSFYTVSGSNVDVRHECHLGSATGQLKSIAMSAKVDDPKVPAKMSLDVGGFYGDYWILDVGEHYEYAVVGTPSRSYLWILSRTPTLDGAVMKGILDRAQSKKFDTSRIEYTPQP